MQNYHRRRSSKSILLPRIVGNPDNGHHSAGISKSMLSASSAHNMAPQHYYLHSHQPNNANLARRMTVHLPETIPDKTYLYGYILLMAAFLMFTVTLYSIVASPYMPDTQVKILDWVKYDDYYCLLLPITAIVWIYWVLWNWMGMKFFRHN